MSATTSATPASEVTAETPAIPSAITDQIATALKGIPPENFKLEEVAFNFKTDKVTKVKRETVKLVLPFTTMDGLANSLVRTDEAGEKIRNYVLSLLADDVVRVAKEQVADDTKPVNKQTELDVSKLSLEAIATMPKSERTGGGIPKETWEAFGKDYATVMLSKGTPADKVARAVEMLTKRFSPCKTLKPAIEKLLGFLRIWFTSTTDESRQEFAECYEHLINRGEMLMKIDEADIVDSL